MPSRADRERQRLIAEQAARVLALLLLGVLLVSELRHVDAAAPRGADSATLVPALRESTVEADARPLLLRLSAMPAPAERDWAAALRRAGVDVRWSAGSLAPVAVGVEPLADPRGGVEVHLWRGDEQPAVLVDAAGELARLDGDRGASTFLARRVVRHAELTVPGATARAAAADSLVLRDVLVLGRAGWEARFLLRSLEELGWRAHARLYVAPGVSVVQGTVTVPDTSRHAVVIVLDSAAAPSAAAISRYVRAGGGVLLVGEGARGGFAPLAAAAIGSRSATDDEPLPVDAPRSGLSLHPLERVRDDALVLERRGSAATVAARRVGSGRVVQVGYDDSWRLRMEGGDAGPELHRDWWARLLAASAYAPARPLAVHDHAIDPVPLASLIAALGSMRTAEETAPPRRTLPPLPLLITALALLLGEWGSRRLRGAP